MRTDHLMMLFPLGLEAPSPWTADGPAAGPALARAESRWDARARLDGLLGQLLPCMFREARCSG